MEHEYEVLSHLQENKTTTQRQLSKQTGLSLGAVNLLLKKMVRKGLIKMEKLNARTVRYILTPKGMQEKSRLTYRYVRNSYRQIKKINQFLDYLIAEWGPAFGDKAVLIYGPDDEIREILIQHLNHKNVACKVCDQAEAGLAEDNGMIIIWREEEEQSFTGSHQPVNIMTML